MTLGDEPTTLLRDGVPDGVVRRKAGGPGGRRTGEAAPGEAAPAARGEGAPAGNEMDTS